MPLFPYISYLTEYLKFQSFCLCLGGGGKKKKGVEERLGIILMMMLGSSLIKAFCNKWHRTESMCSTGSMLLSVLTSVVISGRLLHLF